MAITFTQMGTLLWRVFVDGVLFSTFESRIEAKKKAAFLAKTLPSKEISYDWDYRVRLTIT